MPGATFMDSIPDDVKIGLLELALTCLDGYLLYGFSKRCNEKEGILKALKVAPSLESGSELENYMQQGENETLPYAAIRGKVSKHKHVIPASINGVQSVYRITENQEVYSKVGWNLRRYNCPGSFYEKVEFHPFRLTTNCDTSSTKGANSFLLINDVSVPNTENILATYPTIFESNSHKSPWYNAIFGYLFGTSTLAGAQRTERLLPVDEVVTAIGRIVKTAQGQYVLTAPTQPNALYILTTQPVDEIIEEYRGQTTELGLIVCLLTVGGIWLLFDAIQRAKNYFYPSFSPEEEDVNDPLESLYKAPEDNSNDDNGIPDSVLCVVCQEVSRDRVLFPCKHFCTCTKCALQIQQVEGPCPICRRKIDSTIRIYMP